MCLTTAHYISPQLLSRGASADLLGSNKAENFSCYATISSRDMVGDFKIFYPLICSLYMNACSCNFGAHLGLLLREVFHTNKKGGGAVH